MTTELRRELARIAETAPMVAVPNDTWRLARHSVVRDRVTTVAATAAVVAITAGGAAWLPHRLEAPVTKTATEAIPARLWYPSYDDTVASSGLATGPVSAVFVRDRFSRDAQVVAVLAETGDYRTLDLPDPAALDQSDTLAVEEGLQLSPDGRQLAYVTVDRDHAVGVAVVDLVDGSVRRVTVPRVPGRPDDLGTGDLTWSPGGRYLVWRGRLLAPGATTATTLPLGPAGNEAATVYAVDDDGTVAILDRDSIATWREGQVVSDVAVPAGLTESSPQAAQVVGGEVVDLRMILDSVAGEPLHLLARHGTDPTWAEVPRWPGAELLGWDANGRFLAQIMVDQEFAVHRYTLADGAVTEKPAVEVPTYLDGLSLAVDLPIADRPAPAWADEGFFREHTTLLVVLGGSGMLALLWVRRTSRRYRAAR